MLVLKIQHVWLVCDMSKLYRFGKNIIFRIENFLFPGLLRKLDYKLRLRIKSELKGELKSELIQELSDALKIQLKNELVAELKAELWPQLVGQLQITTYFERTVKLFVK